ncbi:MAG: uracil phosphoribosyltransferase [Firmicutes bacterium]|nr:uracil phosphoribosyltransferase [Bacillota bacterium]
MSKLTIFSHPLINHKLTIARDENTGMRDFRAVVNEIGGLMAYEITRDLPEREVKIKTPICVTTSKVLAKDIVIVPILRAGIGMVDGIHNLIPNAKIGHVGLYRDEETLEPHEYYAKFPKNMNTSQVLLVDPMIATGGSVVMAIEAIKKRGATDIKLVGLVAAPEGIKRIQEEHPDVDIYLAALDEKLNEIGYIVPGLGDCGDRLFGTK